METGLTRIDMESEHSVSGRGGGRSPSQAEEQNEHGTRHVERIETQGTERHEKRTQHGETTTRVTTQPMTLDMLARQDDKPATEVAPAEIQDALASHWTVVTMPAGVPTQLASEAAGRGVRNANPVFVLPEGSFIGTAVAETRRHALGSLPVPASSLEPHRPGWAPLTHTPRISGVDRVLMRRRSGRLTGRVWSGERPDRVSSGPIGTQLDRPN